MGGNAESGLLVENQSIINIHSYRYVFSQWINPWWLVPRTENLAESIPGVSIPTSNLSPVPTALALTDVCLRLSLCWDMLSFLPANYGTTCLSLEGNCGKVIEDYQPIQNLAYVFTVKRASSNLSCNRPQALTCLSPAGKLFLHLNISKPM